MIVQIQHTCNHWVLWQAETKPYVNEKLWVELMKLEQCPYCMNSNIEPGTQFKFFNTPPGIENLTALGPKDEAYKY